VFPCTAAWPGCEQAGFAFSLVLLPDLFSEDTHTSRCSVVLHLNDEAACVRILAFSACCCA
jgi:hypothetical protein